MDLYEALLLDSFSLLICAFLLWKYARLSAFHPGASYLLFHILVFSSRAYFVLGGSPTLFSGWGHGVIPVSQAEIAWAMNLADLALVSMTAAWIKVAHDDLRKAQGQGTRKPAESSSALLSPRVIRNVGVIAFPVGIVALIYFAYTPAGARFGELDLGNWNSSSWTIVTQSWPGLVLLSLIYYYGFRMLYVIPLGIYLLVMAMQGFDRFRVVIPLLYFLLVWLSRNRRRWPPLWMVGAGVLIILMIFPLKTIGHLVQGGNTASDIIAATTESFTDVAAGRSGDQMVLDEFASIVSLVDESKRYYYGTLYYPILTLPIPRQLWQDKPALNWYQHDLSTTSRPMARAGMVSTLHGESYANVGPLGIIMINFAAAYWLGKVYFAAIKNSYFSVYRFAYIGLACNLVQVFRDGLFSLVMFTVVNMMPLVAIAILSYASFRRKKSRHLLRPPFAPSRSISVTRSLV